MAIKKRRKVKLSRGKVSSKMIVGILGLLVGIPLATGVVLQQTSIRNFASEEKAVEAVPNVNTGKDIISSLNPDGTMGPQTVLQNYSATQPADSKGKIEVVLKTVDTYVKPSSAYYDTSVKPSYAYNGGSYTPSSSPNYNDRDKNKGKGKNDQYGNDSKKNGPVKVKSLKLTIIKGEVHYASKPSYDNANSNKGNGNAYGKDKNDNKGKGNNKNDAYTNTTAYNQGPESKVDKWETLAIKNPTEVDLYDDSYASPLSLLGITELAAGKYTQIRLYISAAKATLEDGTTYDVHVLNKDKVIKIVRSFTIEAGKSTKLSLDVNKSHSVVKAGDVYILKPVVAKMDVEY